jgi:excisionase family DNA binding protein
MEDYYTTGEAARILKVTEARVRQMLGAGELEGSRDPVSDRWRIPQHAVHARLEQRRPSEAPKTSADAREWIERVTELERELGRLEGRLELTEVAESTLREQLERERERADRLEERTAQLRDELEDERSKGFWARLFGG